MKVKKQTSAKRILAVALVSSLVITLVILNKYSVDNSNVTKDIQTGVSTVPSPTPFLQPKAVKTAPTKVTATKKPEVVTSEVLRLVNIERIKRGKKSLIEVSSLNTGATARAKFMKQSGQWSHAGYENAVKSYLNNKNAYVGENLGRYISSESELVREWVASPTHLDVMTQNFTYAGVGRFEDHWVLWLSTSK